MNRRYGACSRNGLRPSRPPRVPPCRTRRQDESMTSSVRYRGGHIYSAADPRATAMLVTDGRIEWLGADDDAPPADVTVNLDGALVTPAFVDAHVHSTNTGLMLG